MYLQNVRFKRIKPHAVINKITSVLRLVPMKIINYKAVRVFMIFLCLFRSMIGEAQNTLEFTGGPQYYSAQVPNLKGPTSVPQTLRFFKNHSGSADDSVRFSAASNELSVTFILEDQSYVAIPEHNTGMTFGALPGWSKTNVRPTL